MDSNVVLDHPKVTTEKRFNTPFPVVEKELPYLSKIHILGWRNKEVAPNFVVKQFVLNCCAN